MNETAEVIRIVCNLLAKARDGHGNVMKLKIAAAMMKCLQMNSLIRQVYRTDIYSEHYRYVDSSADDEKMIFVKIEYEVSTQEWLLPGMNMKSHFKKYFAKNEYEISI